MSSRPVVFFAFVLLAACSRSSTNAVPAAASSPTVAAAMQVDDALPPAFPPDACTLDGYRSFFEAFVRTPASRRALTLPAASAAPFDVALRDYSWVLASDPDTLLDIEETRSGPAFSVRVRPVERDENDEITKVLGPTRTYRFILGPRCWNFAGID
jgi:hypothetical protein